MRMRMFYIFYSRPAIGSLGKFTPAVGALSLMVGCMQCRTAPSIVVLVTVAHLGFGKALTQLGACSLGPLIFPQGSALAQGSLGPVGL